MSLWRKRSVMQANSQLTAEDFEIFIDPSYYDMWCLKPKKSRNFDLTLHFSNEREANHALYTILEWFK